jgi:magnesium chelatase subunit I
MDSILGLVRHTGNDGLFRAIEMSLLATASGQPLHLHAEGLRGTGKTTMMRAVRRVLPRIRRIKGCLYNCDPAQPHCPNHRSLSAAEAAALGEEWTPMPFLEISHSAKVGTVVGSIDLSKLVDQTRPEAALLPGTIPQAHRGIIFVDEINRLAETAPELADILLDVMGTKPGRVQIEETGLPAVELPVQVTVWAASNPDEDPGPLEDIRRQLSDRFDFVVYTDRPGDVAAVEEILAAAGGPGWHRPLSPAGETKAELFRAELAERTTRLLGVQVPQPLRQQVADLYSRFNVESLRAVQAIQLGMRLAACLEGRAEAEAGDLARVAPLALRHRVDQETIKKVTNHLTNLHVRPEAPVVAVPKSPRFSGLNFGGAVMEAPPEAPSPAPEQGAAARMDKPANPMGERRDWPTQHPPGAREPQASRQADPWWNRALEGFRRGLGGLTGAQPAMRPEPGRGAGRNYTENPAQSLTGSRPGRLYQQAEQQQAARSQTESGGSGGARSGRNHAQAPAQVGNPLDHPPDAPPNLARPISALQAHELIRTEEELGRR